MPHKCFWRVALVAILCVALAAPAQAGQLQTDATLIVVGIVAVTAAVAVLATVLVLHHKHHDATLTGCISSGPKGMTVTDEKDKRTYRLTGDTAAIKAGDRMTLQGYRKKQGSTFVFEARSVSRDFGACRP